jgi:predicted unusual protein kinase regulating ubiquinone biosynthesis (AarF/ABC1/UbiB family)
MPAPAALPLTLCGNARKRVRAVAVLGGTAALRRALPAGALVLRAGAFGARAGALAAAQALLGTRARCVALQVAVAAARWLPRVPGLRRLGGAALVRRAVLAPLAAFAAPLAGLWAYGACARVFAPGHWRNLQFWRHAVLVYSRYRATKRAARGRSDDVREKMWARRHEWGAERVYALCVELRGNFVKTGQYLGSRTDFVPAAWCERLRELQDHVPPVAWPEVEATLKRSFRVNRATQLFRWLDRRPLASATVAQVHRGELKDGTCVVVKAQYREQEALCRMDVRKLRQLASFLQRHDMSFFDLGSVVAEMERQIPGEFDFLSEAVAMTLVADNMAAAGLSGDIVVPRAIPGLVSRRALVMTYVDGLRADNLVALRLFGIRPARVVRAVARAVGQQMLVDGLLHADLHLGNLLVLRDGRVALLDFGQTKLLADPVRHRLCAFYTAMASNSAAAITAAFLALGIVLDAGASSASALDAAAAASLIPVYANGLLDTAPLPPDMDLSPFSSRSPLQTLPIKTFPPHLLMVLRTVGALRALAESLAVDDELVLSRVFAPFAAAGARARNEPARHARRAREAATRLLPGWAEDG